MEIEEEQETISKYQRLESLHLSGSTKSPETFSLARTWVADCLKNHSKCNTPSEGTWYPTRLLDLDQPTLEESTTVQLVETKITPPSGPYTTLSHCWGNGHSLTLNRETYQELLGGVPLSSLPQTFQDALHVSHQLGVRYLWIDAMCIFQDAGDIWDWGSEVSLMHRVYSNSRCNIVAAETPNSHHSVFNSRDPSTMLPPIAEVTLPSSRQGNSKLTARYDISNVLFWRQVEESRINQRGWVKQERFMSPRALHFGAEQLFWECREKNAAEMNPDGLGLHATSGIFKSNYVDSRDRPRDDVLALNGYFPWVYLVDGYTSCALSFPSEKLIAFSAIAKQVAAVFNDQYVAGMWRRFLGGQLIWSESNRSKPTCYDTYIAPSWSWMSVKGRINSSTNNWSSLIRVEDYELQYVTDDRMGAISGGWLRLIRSLKRMKLLRWSNDELEFRSWTLVVSGLEAKSKRSENPWSVFLDDVLKDYEEESKNGILYCMPAKNETVLKNLGTQYDVLLFKLLDATKGTFQRIGLANALEGEVGHMFTFDPADEGTYPCVEYKDGLHTICIL
ncbi:heterokaryon incompatibility protein-domain-containing protein [Ilyonectria sp. MPI-CAGE-AT-0026]|nr:heterokaryon incompatibility protein-domain-containing protein [Ilyonectria sp. MPI-CAGE-AT-0026]